MFSNQRVLIGIICIILAVDSCYGYFGHHGSGASSAADQKQSNINDNDDKNCFCELKGSINDCSCTVDTVDYFNNNKIYPRIQSILVKDYFRFYKVNLIKQCPYWEDDSKCSMKFCSVSTCDDKDIPFGLKVPDHDGLFDVPFKKYTADAQNSGCTNDHNAELSYLNTSISKKALKGFERWADFDETEDNYCIMDDHQDGAEYVDLLLNPERYTGYKGESAHRVWRNIYLENCFGVSKPVVKSFISHMGNSPYMGEFCMEQRAFYRLISGLHTSINIHLSGKYLMSDPTDFVTPSGVWGRNLNEFKRRFSPETTDNEGPHWLKNLYFAYIVEMRALAKAAEYLKQEKYYTGDKEEDVEVRSAVADLLTVIESFPSHFNETLMFSGGYESLKLKSMFREKFRNISKIMDCVGCDKCRLWGKLQVQGLGTALKILFSGKFDVKIGDEKRKKDPFFRLRRGEIVSLFNAFGRLSTSINELEEFRKVLR